MARVQKNFRYSNHGCYTRERSSDITGKRVDDSIIGSFVKFDREMRNRVGGVKSWEDGKMAKRIVGLFLNRR